jgi:S-layer protein
VHSAGIGALTVSGAAATTGLEIKSQSDTDATTFNFTSGALAGAADTVNVALNGNTGALTLTINDATGEIETLAFTGATSSTGVVTLAGDGLDATTVTIGGAAGMNLSGAAITSNTIDASANSGGVKLLSAAASGAATITGGSGNDRVDITNTLTVTDTLVGGAGTDTIVLNTAPTALTGARITGFEVVQVGASGLTFDNDFLSVSSYTVEDGVSAATLSDLLNNTTITLAGDNGGTVTANVKTNTTTDVMNLTFGNTAAATQTLAKLEGHANVDTLNIASGGGGANIITAMDLDVDGMNITGAQNFTITAITNNAGASEQLEIIDASALTGALNVTLTNADLALTVTGSATAANTVVLSGAADTYVGGAGVDIVTGAAGNDTITLGGGADDYIVPTLAATASNQEKDIVKDFVAGTDDLDINFTMVDDAGANAAVTDFLDVAAGAVTTTITGNRTVSIFEFSHANDLLGEGVTGTFNAVTDTGANLEAAVIEQIATDVAVAQTAGVDTAHMLFVMYDESGNAVICNFTDNTTGNDVVHASDFFEFVVLENVAQGAITAADFV